MTSIDECNTIVEDLQRSDPRVQVLLHNLFGENWKISCIVCSNYGIESKARAFITVDPSEIILCANKLGAKREIKSALQHEAIHAYDYTKKRCDFSSCKGLAYTEVRAAREAECSGHYPFEWLRNSCIKTCATNATSNFFPRDKANKCVRAVFDKAVRDIEPTHQDAAGKEKQ